MLCADIASGISWHHTVKSTCFLFVFISNFPSFLPSYLPSSGECGSGWNYVLPLLSSHGWTHDPHRYQMSQSKSNGHNRLLWSVLTLIICRERLYHLHVWGLRAGVSNPAPIEGLCPAVSLQPTPKHTVKLIFLAC